MTDRQILMASAIASFFAFLHYFFQLRYYEYSSVFFSSHGVPWKLQFYGIPIIATFFLFMLCGAWGAKSSVRAKWLAMGACFAVPYFSIVLIVWVSCFLFRECI